jgi:hypothetical protein
LTYVVEVQDEATHAWFEAFVDATTGELVSVTDFVAKATYRVLPIWKQTPTDGFENLKNPEDKTASPYGWLSTNGVTFNNFTAGNNAVSAIGPATARMTAPDEFLHPYTNGADPFTTSLTSTASPRRPSTSSRSTPSLQARATIVLLSMSKTTFSRTGPNSPPHPMALMVASSWGFGRLNTPTVMGLSRTML